jgi:photosystem II stability/assembly factor-like uncharacterized protein
MQAKFLAMGAFIISIASASVYSQSLWKEIPLPYSSVDYKFIDFSDSLSGWIFTGDGIYIRTMDGGKTWIKDWLGAPHSIRQIKAISKWECWIVYSDEPGKVTILETKDGTNWKVIPIPDSLNNVAGRRKLEFTSPSTIWLPSTPKGIFVTKDYGQSWQRNHATWGVDCNIDFSDSLNGYLAFGIMGPGGETYGTTLRTKNGGMSWDTLYYNSYSSLRQVKYYTAAYGYTISVWTGMDGYPHYEYLGINNGISSISFNSSTLSVSSVVGALHYLNGENFILTAANQMKRMSGDTTYYTLSPKSDGSGIVAFESVPERWNWILTPGNHLFQSVDIPTAVARNTDARIEDYSLTNYPNPFNSSTTISFSLPSRSMTVLKVFDLMGRDVATLASEELPSGVYTRTWNASGFPSGVYFYRLQAGGHTATKNLELVK